MSSATATSNGNATGTGAAAGRTVLVWYHHFDLRIHDHLPLAHALAYSHAYLDAHPAQRPLHAGSDVVPPEGRNSAAAKPGAEHTRLVLPDSYAHVMPVFVWDVERWMARLTLASMLDGPTATAKAKANGIAAELPLDRDDTDITDARIPHPSEEAPRALAHDELVAAGVAGYGAESATARSIYLSPQSILQSTTMMKCDIKRAAFLHECAADLQRNLRSLGSDLLVRVGRTEDVIANLMRELSSNGGGGVAALYTHVDYASEEQEVSSRVAAACAAQGVPMRSFEGNTLCMHADLPWPIDKVPDVFTPFRTKVELLGPAAVRSTKPYSVALQAEQLAEPDAGRHERTARVLCHQPSLSGFRIKGVPPQLASQLQSNELPTLQQLGFSDTAIRRFTDPHPHARSSFPFRGGETAALERLHQYLYESHAIDHYKDTRNQLNGVDYSSKFSPFLSAGCLSARRIWEEVQLYESRVVKNTSTHWLIVELLFRDHFRFLADKYGKRIFWKYGPNPNNWTRLNKEKVEWRTDVKLLRAWCLGLTGYPFIDACMRELLHTGYMSNRGRQVVASFLLHDLKLDWRLGAAWFESQLVDHDVPSNYGNWTFQAGVAFDPRSPYRYFNIHKQAAMYDPHHSHIKLWLPELRDLQGHAHTEHKERASGAEAQAATAAVATIGDAHGVHSALYPYPKPIVPLQSDSHHSSSVAHGSGDRPERKKKVQSEQKQPQKQQLQNRQKQQPLHHDPTPGCNGMETGAGGEAPPELQQQQRHTHVRGQRQQQQQQLAHYKDGPERPMQRVQQQQQQPQQQRLQHQPQHEPQQGRSHHGRNGGDRNGWRDSRGVHSTAHSGRLGDAGPRTHDAPRFAHNPFDRNAMAHSNSAHSLNRPGSSYRSADGASSSSNSSGGGGGGGDSRPLQVIRDLGMRPAPNQRERPALNAPLQPPNFRRPS